jgi:two-component system, chemotaxis family, protein-glutamate methylesterase/glutaminase
VIRVLVVDDSALVRKLFGRVLSAEPDVEVAFARNGVEALEQLTIFEPDVVTLDVQMPEMDGLACLNRIMIERPCPVVMVSSLTAEGADATLEALRLGAVDFVPKPDGAVSLHISAFAPQLLLKIRSAANIKLKASRRLRERVQHRIGGAAPLPFNTTRPRVVAPPSPRAFGKGLVLVGTSTGGPPALEALLEPLPAGFPWSILVVQHMPASFTGSLARRLDGLCAIRVAEVTRPMLLEPGCAYIGRGDADLIVSRRAGGLAAMPAPALSGYPWRPSADRLVRTAMEQLPPSQLIGILMTGMGNDGADAMTLLHSLGGKTIAEAEETAVVWGMPGELARAGGADWILPVHKIAEQLRQLAPADAPGPQQL